MKKLILTAALLISMIFASQTKAESSYKAFTIKGGTDIYEISLPQSWQAERQKGQVISTTLFRPKEKSHGGLMISIIPLDPNLDQFKLVLLIRGSVIESGNSLLPQSVEENLDLKEMEQKRGYYYSLTDANFKGKNKEEEFEYVTQGQIILDERSLLMFSILNNEGADYVKKAGLKGLNSLKKAN